VTTLSAEQQIALVSRLRDGDSAAEDELAELFAGRLRMMIGTRLHDRETARDLAQEALMAGIVALRSGQLREPERLAAFIYGVGRNVANNYIRKQQASAVEVELEPFHALVESAESAFERQQERALADRALATLGADERGILTLTLVEGLKPGEIARRLGLPVDVVRARKSRALKKVVAEVRRLSRSELDGH
jgi:RNA polymerase sigma-70 factor (ECF subfamily)